MSTTYCSKRLFTVAILQIHNAAWKIVLAHTVFSQEIKYSKIVWSHYCTLNVSCFLDGISLMSESLLYLLMKKYSVIWKQAITFIAISDVVPSKSLHCNWFFLPCSTIAVQANCTSVLHLNCHCISLHNHITVRLEKTHLVQAMIYSTRKIVDAH